MPKTHHLKTLPVYFDAVRRGDKTFEIRKNDRDFQTGDTLVLKEWDPAPKPYDPTKPPPPQPWGTPVEVVGYSGREVVVDVVYSLSGDAGVLAGALVAGHVVMGIRIRTAPLDMFPEHPMAPSERLMALRPETD